MEKSIPVLVASMIIGIIITYNFITRSIYIFLISILVSAIILAIELITSYKNSYILLIFYLLGIFLVLISIKNPLMEFSDRECEIYGKIHLIGRKNNYTFKVKKIKIEDKIYNVNNNINLRYYGEDEFFLGEELVISTILEEPSGKSNPKLFDYKKYLNSCNIHTKSNFKDKDIIYRNKNLIEKKYRIKTMFSNFVENTMHKYLNPKSADLITGIILGDYSSMEEDDIRDYRELGLAHILAVSGLHIGIISNFVFLILSNLGLNRKYSFIIILILIWIYGFLIGYPVSVLRANIMISISYLAKMLHEPEDKINSIFISMLILLIFNPLLILNISFKLSYGAILSLYTITPRLKTFFYPYENKLVDSLSAIIAVQLGLLPIQMYYFNYISIVGFLANIIIIPIISLALVVASSILFLELIFMPVNIILGLALNKLMGVEGYIFKWLKNFKYLNINLFSPDFIEIIGYYILVIIAINFERVRKIDFEIIKFTCIISCLSIILLGIEEFSNNKVEIHFIDVGQGDSILIKNNFYAYLFDTGGEVFGDFSIGKNITVPYLIKNNIHYLDGVFISHFHEDHSKGLIDVLESMGVGNIFISYDNEENKVYKYLLENNIDFKYLKAGDSFVLGNKIESKVLSPKKKFVDMGYSENDLSMVIYMKINNRKLLLTGDIEEKIEKYLINKYNLSGIDFIKVAHHGSKTSSTEDFVNSLGAKNSIFTLGRNNSFGHPDEEVVRRYRSNGSNIYRTDYHGRILLEIGEDGSYSIERYLDNNRINYVDVCLYALSFITTILLIIYEKEKKERYSIGL